MKLNSAIKKHLLKIAEGFAKDQKVNTTKQRELKIEQQKNKFVEDNATQELKDLHTKLYKTKDSIRKLEQELDDKVSEKGLRQGSNGFWVSYSKANEIERKVDANANIQWDVILSTVALKLELCTTYEEAKQLIEDVTGANVDTMITTIIPPNMQLTNNN